MSGAELIRLPVTDSTNTWLKEHRGELPHGAAVTARRQTSGRGRLGHEWLDAEGMLPLSVLLKSPPFPQYVTLGVSLAVCDAVEPLIGERLGIKWPNDIILRGHKLCGILCESAADGEGIDIICGVGVNISQSADFFCAAGIPHGGSLLSVLGASADRDALAVSITENILRYSLLDFAEYRAEYVSRSVTVGQEVRIISPAGERSAFAEGIAESGHLICRIGEERFEVNSGEVSVRGLLGYV